MLKRLFHLLIFIPLVFFRPTVCAQEKYLLTTASNERLLMDQLLNPQDWVPFPAYCDREGWKSYAEGNEDLFIGAAEAAQNYTWPSPTAYDLLAYKREGSRQPELSIMNQRRSHLKNLVLGELMEGKGRFIDQIINGVWAFCESTTWCAPAHYYLQHAGFGLPDVDEPSIDLYVGEVSSLLAWTYYFFHEEFDLVDPLISKRLTKELYEKSLRPYYDRIDFWWMSFDKRMYSHINNWNPWINSNMLNTILLVENDSLQRAWYTYKSMRSVDQFINTYPDDGGCDEGPGYWGMAGGALYEYLHILDRASAGAIKVFDKEIIRNIGTYITKVNVAYPYVLNFADAGPRGKGRAHLIYRYGQSIGDEGMMDYAAFLAEQNEKPLRPGGNIPSTLINLKCSEELIERKGIEPLLADFYLPDLQVAGGRDRAGSTKGFFLGMKAGSNGENHNHNDVGSFMVYFNGKPVLIDVGVANYSKATFDPVERWKLWYMQSQYHNTPVINGFQQLPGAQFRAKNVSFTSTKGEVRFSADIAGAYPEEAGISSWHRELVLRRGRSISISEDFKLEKKTGKTILNYMTCIKPEILSSHELELKGEDFSLRLDSGENTKISFEEKAIVDNRLKSYWGERVYRIMVTYKGNRLKDSINVVLVSN